MKSGVAGETRAEIPEEEIPEEEIVERLISKYNTPVPRYTSYPTALEFESEFDENVFLKALEGMSRERAVSVYIHIPFCEVRCNYCGCNVIISRRKEMLDTFIEDLLAEMSFKVGKVPFRPSLAQIHFGGGTPNFLRPGDWQRIMEKMRELFDFDPNIEIGTELNPMEVDRAGLDSLKGLGFNRVSFGVQDVTEKTQEAAGRPQEMGHVEDLINYSRELGFESVNVDFIYGLPYQSVETYQANLQWIEKMMPDRMAVFSYAHIPWIKKHQEKMPLEAIPDAAEKLRIYLGVRKRLKELGYVEIGMDHYALPEDPISKALEERKLHRNFMGYTTLPDSNMLAFGPSAISYVDGVFAQNHVKLRAYEAGVRSRQGMFEKGYQMTPEDKTRSRIIHSIMNNLFLDIPAIEAEFHLNFEAAFDYELQALKDFAEQGLVLLSREAIEVTPTGLHVVRHIASTFDIYRRSAGAGSQKNQRFSKGI